MHEGPTENRLGELGSLYKYYYYYYYYTFKFVSFVKQWKKMIRVNFSLTFVWKIR